MKAELRTRLGELAERLEDPSLTDRLEQRADAITPDDSAHAKRMLREELWTLREKLGDQPLEVREAFERARNSAFDNSWERSLKGYPNQRFVVKPEPGLIPNYDEVQPGIYRGGQATSAGVDWLVSHDFQGTIDLRGDDRDNQWSVPAWGNLERYSIPVPDFQPPTFAQVEEFIARATDPANQPVLVHCKAGIGRTGVMVACLRVSQGMSADEAITLERINSYAGTLAQEGFVRSFADYWAERTAAKAAS